MLNSKNIIFMTDKEAAALLGARLRQYRVQSRLTRQEVAQRMGVSLSTVRNIEKGVSGTIDHLLSYLRATSRLEQINALIEPPRVSPIQIAKLQKPLPVRVRKTKPIKSGRTK